MIISNLCGILLVYLVMNIQGGQTEVEMARVDMLADQAMDFRNGLVRLVYNPRFVRYQSSSEDKIKLQTSSKL